MCANLNKCVQIGAKFDRFLNKIVDKTLTNLKTNYKLGQNSIMQILCLHSDLTSLESDRFGLVYIHIYIYIYIYSYIHIYR